MLITFEGGECCGKDSQIERLAKRLFENNYLVHSHFYEPGITLKAEVIRLLLKNKYDSSFIFPGDFSKTFNLEKYADEFKAETVPEIASNYLNKALNITKQGVKHEVIYFLLNNEFPDYGTLQSTIRELNLQWNSSNGSSQAERCGTFTEENIARLHSPFDLLLANYFSNDPLNAASQMYLYMAARNILHHRPLKDAISEHDVVIINRSRDSSTVYQGYAQNPSLKGLIRELNTEATEGIVPDLTIVLDLPVTEVFRRKAMRDQSARYTGLTKDFFDEKKAPFHRSIRDGYLEEAEYYSKRSPNHPEYCRIKVIDGMGTYEEVHERIWFAVKEKLNEKIDS